MELLDRYLNAVRFWLPRGQQQDIITELSEDIRSQIEEQEAQVGRSLTEAEIEAILQRYGDPMTVAGRFRPQRYLVGPALFPLYVFVLKVLAAVYFVPWLIVWLFFVIFVPSYRALDLPATLRSVWMMALPTFTFVTLGFAFLERSQAKSRVFAAWNVRNLPPPRDPNHISRGAAVTSIIAAVVFVVWWVGGIALPAPGTVRPAPVVTHVFYWPVLLLAVAGIPVTIVDVFRPWWTPRRAAIALVLDGSWLAITVLMLALSPLIQVSASEASPDRIAEAVRWINLPVLFTLFICAISFALRIVQDLRRLLGKPPVQSRALTFLIGE